jgi:hypothetical protein
MVNRTKPEHRRTMGAWTWNSKLLNEKVIKGTELDCWPSTNFSQTKHGPLFGVTKNGKPQMTQLCRILYRDWFNIDCEENEIAHKCGDKTCLNFNHWEVKPNKKHGARPNKQQWWME